MSIAHTPGGSPIPAWLCLGDLAIRTASIQSVHVNDGRDLGDKSLAMNLGMEGGGFLRWSFRSADQLNLFPASLDLRYTPTTPTVTL